MTIKKLKEHFQNQDVQSLLDEISTLYKTFDVVKEYYDSRLEFAEPHEIAQKYKKILEEQFCPKRGFPQLKYSVARKAISDFKKVCSDYLSILDLQLTVARISQGKLIYRTTDINDPLKYKNEYEERYEEALRGCSKTSIG